MPNVGQGGEGSAIGGRVSNGGKCNEIGGRRANSGQNSAIVGRYAFRGQALRSEGGAHTVENALQSDLIVIIVLQYFVFQFKVEGPVRRGEGEFFIQFFTIVCWLGCVAASSSRCRCVGFIAVGSRE